MTEKKNWCKIGSPHEHHALYLQNEKHPEAIQNIRSNRVVMVKVTVMLLAIANKLTHNSKCKRSIKTSVMVNNPLFLQSHDVLENIFRLTSKSMIFSQRHQNPSCHDNHG